MLCFHQLRAWTAIFKVIVFQNPPVHNHDSNRNGEARREFACLCACVFAFHSPVASKLALLFGAGEGEPGQPGEPFEGLPLNMVHARCRRSWTTGRTLRIPAVSSPWSAAAPLQDLVLRSRHGKPEERVDVFPPVEPKGFAEFTGFCAGFPFQKLGGPMQEMESTMPKGNQAFLQKGAHQDRYAQADSTKHVDTAAGIQNVRLGRFPSSSLSTFQLHVARFSFFEGGTYFLVAAFKANHLEAAHCWGDTSAESMNMVSCCRFSKKYL